MPVAQGGVTIQNQRFTFLSLTIRTYEQWEAVARAVRTSQDPESPSFALSFDQEE